MLNVGYFNNELDAAKAVNFKCAELNRPMKNPGLGILQPNSVTFFFLYMFFPKN